MRAKVCCVALCLFLAAVTHAEERYYIIIFGSQSEPKLPRYTHTFGCVIRATGCGDNYWDYELEVHTISWMAASLEVKPWLLLPQKGVNLPLGQTLHWAYNTGNQRVSQWGPYEIQDWAYWQAIQRVRFLESGRVRYQSVDPLLRTRRITDCIHAISDLDRDSPRLRYAWIRFGEDASKHIARQMYHDGVIIRSCEDHSWLNERLGLTHYPIIQRQIKRPPIEFTPLGFLRRQANLPETMPEPDFVVPPGICADPSFHQWIVKDTCCQH